MSLVKFDVTRNSPKWTLNSSGNLQSGSDNLPGFEFNADGSYKGVLVEPESINEAKASEDLDDATYWTDGRTTIAGDTETDPKGGTNSFLLSETVDNDTHILLTASGHRPSVASGETWTQSVFVKKGDGANAPDIIQLTHLLATFGAQYANFDISVGGGTSGTVTASSGGTAGIRYYGNGWYRISWTATSTSAGSNALFLGFTNNNPTATRLPSYAGQTDANVFIWGAQLEESDKPTSYIKTTSSTVTRNEDVITLTSASQYLPSEGKVTLGWEQREDDTIYIGALSASVSSGSRELVYEYSSTEQTLSIDGTEVQTITGQFDFSGMDKIQLGHVNGADQPNTHLKYFAVE